MRSDSPGSACGLQSPLHVGLVVVIEIFGGGDEAEGARRALGTTRGDGAQLEPDEPDAASLPRLRRTTQPRPRQ